MRDRVELVYVTPLPGAFTKPIASAQLGGMLNERSIALEADFVVERIDADRQRRWCRTTNVKCRSTFWSLFR